MVFSHKVFDHKPLAQLAEPLWTEPGIKSGISVRQLISTLKEKKGTGREEKIKQSSKILASD